MCVESNLCTFDHVETKFDISGRNYKVPKIRKHIQQPLAFVQKLDHFSARQRRKRKFVEFVRRFILKYRVFCRAAAYDAIFSNSMGGKDPSCPLRAPMIMKF